VWEIEVVVVGERGGGYMSVHGGMIERYCGRE